MKAKVNLSFVSLNDCYLFKCKHRSTCPEASIVNQTSCSDYEKED